MNILISTGSFKDVFTSIESCRMVQSILPQNAATECVPVCDGGEYTLPILMNYRSGQTDIDREEIRLHTTHNLINPYGKRVDASWLSVGETAYIVSSEILHLTPEEDSHKNPLRLTDYGLGQMIADAVAQGFQDIRLCLGGTSTIGYGIGTAQALGSELYDAGNVRIQEPVTPERYTQISRIVFCPERYKNIRLSVINDGITKASDLDTVNPLKIGKTFEPQKEEILTGIAAACNRVYELTGFTPGDAWSGNGGGIYFGIEHLFETEYFKGADYFCSLFGLEAAMERADLVVTGEGRFDNPHLKKIPVVVSELAKKHGKPVIFLCGQIAPEWADCCECVSEGVYRNPDLKAQYGIDWILSCTEYYASHKVAPTNEIFKEYTPRILKERLESCPICFH